MNKLIFSVILSSFVSSWIFADHLEHSTCIISIENLSKEARLNQNKSDFAVYLQQKNYFTVIDKNKCFVGLFLRHEDGNYQLYDSISCGNINCKGDGGCSFFKIWTGNQLKDLPVCRENMDRKNLPGKMIKD